MRKLATVMLVLAAAQIASASLIPTILSITPSVGNPGAWTWSYRVRLTDDEALDSARPWDQFITIYDIAGYVPGSASGPPPWVPSAQALGINSGLIGPPPAGGDSPGFPNITWTWNGAGLVVGDVIFAPFQFDSLYSVPILDFFEGSAAKWAPGLPGHLTETGNIGRIPVPMVPEPATYMLLGSALLLVGGILRWRTNR